MRKRLALVAGMWLATSVQAQHENHTSHEHSVISSADAQIVVTINPEARVSAMIHMPLPGPPACGSAMALTVKVINQGFVTAPLRAAIAGDGSQHVTLNLDEAKLSGMPEDMQTLHLTPQGSVPADVTIAFSIDDTVGDLAGRDRVHLLVRCQA